MIRALKTLFAPHPQETEAQRRHRQRLAAAALLIETARADFFLGKEEQAVLEDLLSDTLSLERKEVQQLVAVAEEKVDEATSLYEFTRVINDYCDSGQKFQLIADMWAVAYADGDLDKYEEALIRRVAELTYVPHAEYIRAKLAAKGG